MKIIEKKIDELIPYEKNPRINALAIEQVANSIREFGFKVPIVIDKDNVVVAGHTRLKASKRLGLETVPCIVADDLTPEQIRKYRLADNKVNDIAQWDFELMMQELDEITNIDMSAFGFLDHTENLDFIDDMMGSGIAGGEKEKELFNVTIKFPSRERELIEETIRTVGKDVIIAKVIERL